jgi:hypothetical protein
MTGLGISFSFNCGMEQFIPRFQAAFRSDARYQRQPAVGAEIGRRSMKKFVLAATALLLACGLTAEAQSQGIDPGTARRATTTTPGKPAPSKPATVARPAPAPVKVFVPVPVPPVVVFNKSEHRYSQRNHRVCQEKSHRLHSYERHAADDGYLSGRERRTIAALKSDLDRTCGGHRWGG